MLRALLILTFVFSLLFACKAFGGNCDTFEQTIVSTALEHRVDPALALSIAKVESSCNPARVGTKGEIGIYQLRPEFHKISPHTSINIRTAIAYMAKLEKRCRAKYGAAWYVCYNYGPNRRIKQPTKTTYFKKVQREYHNLKGARYVQAR